ncbi:histidine--tRNA ligase [Anaerobacillus isosaccharinicus]|uniref:Histidine--tRNA ligase n=1 Tax=Anaerobacillus isosaccharinicus TaxID=1532552 RepID=A0A1S2LH44_9BACI|nr:histidine--tRNA ligase [Anaerobacillus isosaccharinicus]MBA5585373.1 histidine--tRNA ligase [Anaerobacillus isosaccharinicus]QOY36307.1 histidine--tRNA ligase [Anaerobacillus isosaccharinicus]
MSFKVPRGTQDILPGKVELWQYVEEKARDLCRRYNYKEIRTPMFEQTELFMRGVGDTTDIVQKEMYTFEDRGGRSLTLRPEGTASVVRSYVENKLFGNPIQPTKLYYIGPMFRYERPQSGRMRQFVQFGVEALGSADPTIDAEVIALVMELYRELGLDNLKLVINSLGDTESRNAHREALVNHFKPRIDEFCSDCQSRLAKNPLRILDCKVDRDHELMSNAPAILDYLNEESIVYFEKVKTLLDDMNITFVVDPNLVRGLDYYNNTAFEIMIDGDGFGSITTLCGGGRYNGLVQEIGGPETPGIGFGLSIERLLMALEVQNISLPLKETLDCYVISMGDEAKLAATNLTFKLRQAGLSCDQDYLDKKMKAQMKAADRFEATFVAIIGENELEKNTVVVKEMATGEQEEIPVLELTNYLQKKLN